MKKTINKKTTLIAILLALGTLQLHAQTAPKTFRSVNPNNGMVRCTSVEYDEYLTEKNPNLSADRAQFEKLLAAKIAENKAMRLQSPDEANAVLTIPVVIHIIHNGDAVGTSENIKEGQALSQITVLNQDYRRMVGTPGFNDLEVGADTEIQFCLAQVKPDGSATTGIDRVNMNQVSWTSFDQINTVLKPQTIWDPEQYFNIWVVNFGGDLSDILGYAQFPSSSGLNGINADGGGADSDGVVIGYRYFGSKDVFAGGTYATALGYDKGRTATHEVGHALGLRHIWGDGGSQQAGFTDCNATDYCNDTPFAGWENYDCEGAYDSCPLKTGSDMTNNYMDYTNDACMDVFTKNQKTRMKTVLQNSDRRKNLVTSNVCQVVAGAEEFNLLNGINLYPNPAQTVLNIAVENNELPDSFVIYNSLGQTITTVKVNGSANLVVNTSAYSNGVYFIKIDKGTATKTLKFIKN